MSPLLALVTSLTLLLMFATGGLVAMARGKYQVKAPATTGHPDFERVFRVQMNTMEQAFLFLPALWLAGIYANATLAGYLGLAWLAGRIWYVIGYTRAADKRGQGFLIGMLAFFALWGLATWGIVQALLAR